MTPFLLAVGITVYFVSALLFVGLSYLINRYITVQAVFVGSIPVVNTVSLVLGLITMFYAWYNENKAKVLVDGRVTKTKTQKPPKAVAPKPAKQIPTPKD